MCCALWQPEPLHMVVCSTVGVRPFVSTMLCCAVLVMLTPPQIQAASGSAVHPAGMCCAGCCVMWPVNWTTEPVMLPTTSVVVHENAVVRRGDFLPGDRCCCCCCHNLAASLPQFLWSWLTLSECTPRTLLLVAACLPDYGPTYMSGLWPALLVCTCQLGWGLLSVAAAQPCATCIQLLHWPPQSLYII